jgi:hypothetical protein
MRTILLSLILLIITQISFAQTDSSDSNQYQNIAEKLITSDQNLTIGGYGEVHYNQILNAETRNNGTLDVHRMVLFFGYNFSKRTQFVTEVEVEYAKEVWIEQLFLQHKLNDYMSLKTGLLLIPMGIINEYHEPVTFNGVERPLIDNKIAPSTWREIGIGLTGNILPASLKYQAYMVNGPSGYDGTAGLFNGNNGVREGRQKGSKSYISTPNFSGKVEFYGVKGLNIGLSGYVGKSQSKLYDKSAVDNTVLKLKADSSVIGISMVGLDARYNLKGFEMRGQLYYSAFNNTEQYNVFTQKAGKLNDLGSAMMGYYIEAGYNVLRPFSQTSLELIPFVRYQDYNTHFAVSGITAQDKYEGSVVTTGLTLKLAKGAVLKADVDFAKTQADAKATTTFNAGLGVMF